MTTLKQLTKKYSFCNDDYGYCVTMTDIPKIFREWLQQKQPDLIFRTTKPKEEYFNKQKLLKELG